MLFLTTRQKTKTRNAFAKNMSIDKKLSKSQISKMIQPGGFHDFWLTKIGKKVITDLTIPLLKIFFLD